MSWEKLKIETLALITVYAVFAAIVFGELSNPDFTGRIYGRVDFVAFYTAGKMVSEGNIGNLYDVDSQEQKQLEILNLEKPSVAYFSFKNPPVVAFAFSPLSHIGLRSAYLIFSVLSIAAFFLAVILLVKYTGPGAKVLFWLPLSLPVAATIYHGQISMFLLLALAVVYRYLDKEKWFAAGLASGMLLIKPQFLLLLPYIFVISKERKKFAAGAAVSVLLFFAINTALYGKGFLTDYTGFLINTENLGGGTDISENFNLHSVANLLFGTKTLNLYVIATEAILLIWSFLYLVKKKISVTGKAAKRSALSASIILVLVLNIHTMPSDLVLLTVPVMEFSAERWRNSPIKFLPTALLLIPFVGFFGLQWVAVLLFSALAAYLIRSR